MRYDAEHKQKTRQRILKEAAKAVRSEGPQQVALASIMSKAGLTHGGFYAHFASKDALLAASIQHMFEESAARWLRETQDLPAAQGWAAYIDFYLSAPHRDQRAIGCPMAALACDLPRLSADNRKAFAVGVRNLADAFGKSLAQLGFAQPMAVALSVLNELVGALTLARCEPDRKRSAEMLDASRRQLKARLGLGPVDPSRGRGFSVSRPQHNDHAILCRQASPS